MEFNTRITFLFCLCILFTGLHTIDAQNSSRQKESKLIDKLWFGGNIGLGFSSNQFGSQFYIGLAPMVGYKITEKWSVGPRIDASYTYLKYPSAGNIEKLSFFNVGGAFFTRYKVFNNFFAHLESGITNIPYLDEDLMGDLVVVREQRMTALIGIGYTAGGGEIVLLYDLNAPDDSLELPFDLRFGFNYNF